MDQRSERITLEMRYLAHVCPVELPQKSHRNLQRFLQLRRTMQRTNARTVTKLNLCQEDWNIWLHPYRNAGKGVLDIFHHFPRLFGERSKREISAITKNRLHNFSITLSRNKIPSLRGLICLCKLFAMSSCLFIFRCKSSAVIEARQPGSWCECEIGRG